VVVVVPGEIRGITLNSLTSSDVIRNKLTGVLSSFRNGFRRTYARIGVARSVRIASLVDLQSGAAISIAASDPINTAAASGGTSRVLRGGEPIPSPSPMLTNTTTTDGNGDHVGPMPEGTYQYDAGYTGAGVRVEFEIPVPQTAIYLLSADTNNAVTSASSTTRDVAPTDGGTIINTAPFNPAEVFAVIKAVNQSFTTGIMSSAMADSLADLAVAAGMVSPDTGTLVDPSGGTTSDGAAAAPAAPASSGIAPLFFTVDVAATTVRTSTGGGSAGGSPTPGPSGENGPIPLKNPAVLAAVIVGAVGGLVILSLSIVGVAAVAMKCQAKRKRKQGLGAIGALGNQPAMLVSADGSYLARRRGNHNNGNKRTHFSRHFRRNETTAAIAGLAQQPTATAATTAVSFDGAATIHVVGAPQPQEALIL
jgi:hypothetical protein